MFRSVSKQKTGYGLLSVVKSAHSLSPNGAPLAIEEIRGQFPHEISGIVFDGLLTDLLKEEQMLLDGGNLQYLGPKQKFSQKQKNLIASMVRYAEEAGFSPFTLNMIWEAQTPCPPKNQVPGLLRYLCGQRVLVQLQDSRFLASDNPTGHRFLANKRLEIAKDKIRKHSDRMGNLTLDDPKTLLGISRTIAVRILEHLDAVGFTMRSGNKRIVKKPTPSSESKRVRTSLKLARRPVLQTAERAGKVSGVVGMHLAAEGTWG